MGMERTGHRQPLAGTQREGEGKRRALRGPYSHQCRRFRREAALPFKIDAPPRLMFEVSLEKNQIPATLIGDPARSSASSASSSNSRSGIFLSSAIL